MLHLRLFERAFQVDGPACPKARLLYDILIRGTCMQLTMICRLEMFVAVDAGDRSAEIDQVSNVSVISCYYRRTRKMVRELMVIWYGGNAVLCPTCLIHVCAVRTPHQGLMMSSILHTPTVQRATISLHLQLLLAYVQ